MHSNNTHLALGHPECDGVTPLGTCVVNALQESVIALRGFELTGAMVLAYTITCWLSQLYQWVCLVYSYYGDNNTMWTIPRGKRSNLSFPV